jgi:hypothetical protein
MESYRVEGQRSHKEQKAVTLYIPGMARLGVSQGMMSKDAETRGVPPCLPFRWKLYCQAVEIYQRKSRITGGPQIPNVKDEQAEQREGLSNGPSNQQPSRVPPRDNDKCLTKLTEDEGTVDIKTVITHAMQ